MEDRRDCFIYLFICLSFIRLFITELFVYWFIHVCMFYCTASFYLRCCFVYLSPWAHLHLVRMLRFMSDINQPSLPTPFYSVLVSNFSLCGPFNCISFHKFSRQLSVFSLCSCGLSSALLVLSTIYLFMKVSFSPDIILSRWLGSKHKLTELFICHDSVSMNSFAIFFIHFFFYSLVCPRWSLWKIRAD